MLTWCGGLKSEFHFSILHTHKSTDVSENITSSAKMGGNKNMWRAVHKDKYLSTDYFGTCLIIFDNNMNTIGNHFLYQVRGQISCIYD